MRMNLKIESDQPHKSPDADVSWYHKLLVTSTSKVEGMGWRESVTDTGAIEHGKRGNGACWPSCSVTRPAAKTWIETSHLGKVKRGCHLAFRMICFCFASTFSKISKKLVWCRNKANTVIIPGLKATVTLLRLEATLSVCVWLKEWVAVLVGIAGLLNYVTALWNPVWISQTCAPLSS